MTSRLIRVANDVMSPADRASTQLSFDPVVPRYEGVDPPFSDPQGPHYIRALTYRAPYVTGALTGTKFLSLGLGAEFAHSIKLHYNIATV